MQPVFTLPYPEYAVALELSSHFKKNDGYSLSIPLSRQQKGFDLVLYNKNSKKAITIQVKASRIYPGKAPIKRTRKPAFKYNTWFRRFDDNQGSADCYFADYYFLFGLYEKSFEEKRLDKSRKISKWYNHIILAFNENEMIKFLSDLKTTEKKPDKSFGFGFNDPDTVFSTRGESIEMTDFLISNKVKEIKAKLE